ncbi:MAG: hypothetical protein JW982_14625 [Spirochaetes bacterium]|nr:hypothetical protein [Spirochaetota bacterium]
MSWNVIYFLIALTLLIVSIWKLARYQAFYLGLAGITFFIAVLTLYFIPQVYDFVIIKGLPTFGRILHYIALPVLLVFSMMKHFR